MTVSNEKTIEDFRQFVSEINGPNYEKKLSFCVYDVPNCIHLLNVYFLNENNEPVWMTIAIKEERFVVEVFDKNVTTLTYQNYDSVEEVRRYLKRELLQSKGFYDWKDYYKA